MKSCPRCNRTYTTDTQKFCTHDGGLLVAFERAQDETVRLDATQLDEAPTRAISRELGSGNIDPFKTVMADPFKTVMARPEEDEPTRENLGRDTQDLSPQSAPLPPSQQRTSAPLPPPSSGPITQPPQPSGSLPPSGQQTLASLPDMGSGPIESSEFSSGTLPSLPPLPMPPPGPGPTVTSAPSPPRQFGGAQQAPPSQPSRTDRRNEVLSAIGLGQPAPPTQPAPAPLPARKSKAPLVLGILAVLLILGTILGVAAFIFLPKIIPALQTRRTTNPTPEPSQRNIGEPTPSETKSPNPPTENEPPPYSPPSNAVQFVNSNRNLQGKLAEHYVEFSFYYPKNWQKDQTAGVAGASNFAKVERRLPPDFTQENFAVGWYSSSGAAVTDRALFHNLAESLSSQFKKSFPEYRKISEGETKAGVYEGYEFRFESTSRNTDKGDIKVWGRVIFVPPVDGGKNGVTLLMLATSLAPELKTINDVGVKGELPMMLESFRFGKK